MSATLAPLLATLLSVVFAALAALHLYWGAGGRWAGADALPQRADGTPLFRPGAIACGIVALGLAAIGAVALAQANLLPWPIDRITPRALLRLLAGLFALRTLGDFRYVGLTRRVTGTAFARKDRAFYTPLCAALAAALLVLSFASPAAPA